MLKGRTPLVIAVVLAVLAAIAAFSGIEAQRARVRAGWNLVPVLVAAQDIADGTLITQDMINQRSVPEQFVTSSVVKPDSWNYIVNQKILVPVQAGDPLLWTQFETTKAAERLSTKVQKKTRAVTIEAGRVTAVGGWVRPNDHVDIIGTFKDPQSQETVAVTLIEDVIVLATGKITGTTNVNLIPENQREYNSVSLLVIPEEAELLALARELGTLSLSLRNEEDVATMDERGKATIQSLLTGERTKVLEKKRRDTIQIIRGSVNSGATVGGPVTPISP